MKKIAFSFLVAFAAASFTITSCKKKDDTTTVTVDCNTSTLALTAAVSGSTITVTGSGGTTPYSYSKDGVNFQSSNVFTDVAYGAYTISIKDASCTKTTAITVNSVTDSRDGKIYKLVQIGTQVWFGENLNYKGTLSAGTEDCYNSLADSCTKYGALYDWSGANVACPNGWHLSTDAEWQTLEAYLGMSATDLSATGQRGTDQGTKLQEGGSSGFNAKMSGFQNTSFSGAGGYTNFWSSTGSSGTYYRRQLGVGVSTISRGLYPDVTTTKCCVRCLKN